MLNLDRAVKLPASMEGESLPSFFPVPRQNLCTKESVFSPHKEKAVLHHGTGVEPPGMEAVLQVQPAAPGQLVAGVSEASNWLTLEDV